MSMGEDRMSKLLREIESLLHEKVSANISCGEWHSSIVLEGTVDSWNSVVKAGKLAAKKGYKGVVNRLEVDGLSLPETKKPALCDHFLDGRHVDVLIIGGGVTGSAIARELSKWDISILLVDKEEDLAMHASSRNDGMVHAGIEPATGSKKAIFNVRGNALYTRVTQELDVPFRRSGSIMLFDKWWIRLATPLFYKRARDNGVEGVRFLSREEVKAHEPAVTDAIVGGVFFPTTGVLSPYKLTIAFAENAVQNGAEVSLDTVVFRINKNKGAISSVVTNRGTVYPTIVIDAAGVYADSIARMADDQFFTIHPRKGELVFLDKKKGAVLNSVVGKPSLDIVSSDTKGGGLVKTIDGNVLVGPDAYEQPFREDFSTNRENIERILAKQLPMVPQLSPADVITYCAGIRAPTYEEDFIIEKSEYVANLIYAAGIQSPGLASAPAIAQEIEKLTCEMLSATKGVKRKPGYNPIRRGIPQLLNMSPEERSQFIRSRPDYGVIVCRCEEVSRGEVVDAIHSPIPVYTVDGIKRRVRAGMGRCQGGFCMPLVMHILHDQTHLDMTAITKKGESSNILVDDTRTMASLGGGEKNGNV
jgi:glycerol-3-phosphate dehydrogenase